MRDIFYNLIMMRNKFSWSSLGNRLIVINISLLRHFVTLSKNVRCSRFSSAIPQRNNRPYLIDTQCTGHCNLRDQTAFWNVETVLSFLLRKRVQLISYLDHGLIQLYSRLVIYQSQKIVNLFKAIKKGYHCNEPLGKHFCKEILDVLHNVISIILCLPSSFFMLDVNN